MAVPAAPAAVTDVILLAQPRSGKRVTSIQPRLVGLEELGSFRDDLDHARAAPRRALGAVLAPEPELSDVFEGVAYSPGVTR